MLSFSISPILGLKTNVPEDDPTLFRDAGNGVVATHAVDGKNFRVDSERRATRKADGKILWSNTATASVTNCLGMFELYDGSNRNHWVFMGDNASAGRAFKYDGSRNPVRFSDVADHSGAVEWAAGNQDKYSILRVGDYMVFSDYGEHTPYSWKNGDAVLAKVSSTGTDYKGKYLEKFQRRILLANIDTTQITVGGEYSVIWTDVNPVPQSSCTFGTGDPPSNHLLMPTEDVIMGIKVFARNHCFVYGEHSINRIDYYPNYVTPFAAINMVDGQGCTNHNSIVAAAGSHFFFNENYGFVEYRGGAQMPYGNPISEDIEDTISSIARTYFGHIVGKYIPYKNLIAWAVPLYGNESNSHILFYHLLDKTWSIEQKPVWAFSNWVTNTDISWNDLLDEGWTTWDDIPGATKWSDLVSEIPGLMISSTDGKTYANEGSTDNGSDYDGYRVEPILDFGRPNDKELLLEIWFNVVNAVNCNMYCHYRGGNTPAECLAAAWTALPEVSLNSPANAVVRTAQVNRFHQIRYGTDAENEEFVINRIEFRFVPQGRY